MNGNPWARACSTSASRGRACAGSVPRAFTLIELLIVLGVMALLAGLLLPGLGLARDSARGVRCASNLRQLLSAWSMYAHEYSDRAMPLAYWSFEDIGAGEQIFWWGTHGTATTPPRFELGFVAPYLDARPHERSVFECPSQPWGTYRPQGPAKVITSTYGYNGYFLSPAKTPGWGLTIAHRPWQRLSGLHRPADLLVFADALLPSFGTTPSNTALLDPPLLFDGAGAWTSNPSPTTSFRHAGGASGRCAAAHADGHAALIPAQAGWVTHPSQRIGSIGGATSNGPAYVPDWERW